MSRLLLAFLAISASAETNYLQPPKEILDVLRAPLTPTASLSPNHSQLLLLDNERYPPIAEVSQPVLRLAGIRMNPRTNGPHLPLISHTGMTMVNLASAAQKQLALPAGVHFGAPRWSGDGKHFAFTATFDNRVELWVSDTVTAHRLISHPINAAYMEVFHWMPDNRNIIAKLVPTGRTAPPAKSNTPTGPNIQESEGKAGPVRTYQDLLANPTDEDLFDYYATAQLALIDTASGKTSNLGRPAVYAGFEPSPDGQHLLITRIHRPYSYVLPHTDFPRDVEIWDLGGKLIKQLASLPLAERIQIEGVRPGPRQTRWKPNEPATIIYVVALDGGNPNEKVPHRDRIVTLKPPYNTEPAELLKLQHRLFGMRGGGMDFLEDGSFFVRDYERNKKWVRTFYVNAKGAAKEIEGRNAQDRYKDPGTILEELDPHGERIVRRDGDFIYYSGLGSSPTGDHPFLDRVDLKTMKRERLFQSDNDSYETVAGVISNDGRRILTRHESPSSPPNYFIREGATKIELTHFADPAPQLRSITKQLVTYKRADGVPLSFTLYLPPGYKQGTRLPTVVWAYPREFNDPETAGQVGGSTQRFTTLTGPSHLFFLLRGYAILDDAALPVVGDPLTVNDTYIDQIVAGAKAAIDKATEMGVTDPARVGVGGHSYGAFMTANLLAHSKLFKAGIARSGAYNRTLTPFGFQSERRTIWEAPDVYLKMSPFMNADKIKQPILLIHGEADDNTGTFPIQSDRFYQAIRGNGGTVRLVFLPNEAHAYKARESIEHTLAEMINWFDKYLK